MKDGFIKVAAASPPLRVADCAYNRQQILLFMEKAKDLGVNLLVLPELALTGYTCGDLFGQDTLLAGALDALEVITAATQGSSLVLVVGLPLEVKGRLYNCAAVLQGGKVLGVVPKRNIPGYGEFYETRNFTPGPGTVQDCRIGERWVPFGGDMIFRCLQLPDFCLGVEICEDLWVPQPPSARLAAAGATVIANPSASDEAAGKAAYRRTLVESQSARLCCAYLYAASGGGESTTDLVFSAHNLIGEDGSLLAESPPFGEGFAVTEIDVTRLAGQRRRTGTWPPVPDGFDEIYFQLDLAPTFLTRPVSPVPFVPQGEEERAARCQEILSIQAHGLKKRMEHTRCPGLVLGISGGLDSTLALLVSVRAMDLLGRSLPHHQPHQGQRPGPVPGPGGLPANGGYPGGGGPAPSGHRSRRRYPGRHLRKRPGQGAHPGAYGPGQPHRRPGGGHRGPFGAGPGLGHLQRGPYVYVWGERLGAQDAGAPYGGRRGRPVAGASAPGPSGYSGYPRQPGAAPGQGRGDQPADRGAGGPLPAPRFLPVLYGAVGISSGQGAAAGGTGLRWQL